MKRFKFQVGVRFAALFIVVVLLFSAAVMVLWNAIVSPVLGVRSVTFAQALGLLVLCKILFGGFGRRGAWSRGRNRQWRSGMQEKFAKMTPEEREKFKTEWRKRCGPGWHSEKKDQDNAPAE